MDIILILFHLKNSKLFRIFLKYLPFLKHKPFIPYGATTESKLNIYQVLNSHLFKELVNLKYIYLEEMSLSEISWDLFAISLEEIFLGKNNLTRLETLTFVNQINLEYLYLNENRLAQISSFAFDSLSNLQNL